ncbi:hypothetical protein GCM10022233_57870 [Streptomyces shaanxiensis]|uniref:Secreted protein n=1 Tax=Streptomyces shaanxiensis TaxID=653357 RepID=A0ABP7VS20_9ACTN
MMPRICGVVFVVVASCRAASGLRLMRSVVTGISSSGLLRDRTAVRARPIVQPATGPDKMRGTPFGGARAENARLGAWWARRSVFVGRQRHQGRGPTGRGSGQSDGEWLDAPSNRLWTT